MEEVVPTPEILCPDPGARSFTTPQGITYTVSPGLSLNRGRYLDRMLTEELYCAYLPDHAKTLDRIIELQNGLQFVQASHEMMKLREAHNMVGANRLRDVEICGLFFNAPDEDPTVYDYEAMKHKCYTAWGAVHRDFFTWWSLRLWNGGDSPYSPSAVTAAPASDSPASPTN